MDEVSTRSLPHLDEEIAWARNRPVGAQTPIPQVGDQVMYRHDSWGEVISADVVAVQPLDDTSDPNLWRVERDASGQNSRLAGRVVLSQLDPWPLLTIRTQQYGVGITREARLRGSPGWLPLDWLTRYRPVPDLTPGWRP